MADNFLKKSVGVGIFVLLIVASLAGFFYLKSENVISGNALLDLYINQITSATNVVEGNLKLTLRNGELIPANSKILINQNGKTHEILFSDLVESNNEGQFYVENHDLSGQGEGFGFSGEKLSYPDVHFTLLVSDSDSDGGSVQEENNESNVVEEIAENETAEVETPADENVAPEETTEPSESQETVTETPAETPSEETSESDTSEESPITGNVISSSNEIEGVASKGKDFEYNLEDGQNAEIKSGSVFVDGEEISSSELKLTKEGNKVIVSTDYSAKEEGFGSDFLEDSTVKFEIPLSELNLSEEPGSLEISLMYGENVLAKVDKIIVPNGNIIDNETAEELANITDNETAEEIEANLTEVNITSGNISIETKKYNIVLNKPVKWHKKIVGNADNVSVELPKEAENISIVSGAGIAEAEEQASEESAAVDDKKALITGQVSFEISKKRGFFTVLWAKLLSGFTGRVVADISTEQAAEIAGVNQNEVTDVSVLDEGIVVETEQNTVVQVDVADETLVEYFTPAPTSNETLTASGKQVVISAPDELGYTDVLAYTELDNVLPLENAAQIKVIWHNNDSGEVVMQEMPFDSFDLDSDGNIDYIEWVVPHLSDQIFDVAFTPSTFTPSNTIYRCGDVNVSGVYNLNQSISGDNCLIVKVDNVEINCDGFTISGASGIGVNGNGQGSADETPVTDAYTNITLRSCNVSGFGTSVSANGGIGGGWYGDGGAGGDVNIYDSVLSGDVFAKAGLAADDGSAWDDSAGNAGNILMFNSSARNIDASAPVLNDEEFTGTGFAVLANGGRVIINISDVENVSANGGGYFIDAGPGRGGNISILNSNASFVNALGGPTRNGGPSYGGIVEISDSIINGNITTYGNKVYSAIEQPLNAGPVTLDATIVYGSINAYGQFTNYDGGNDGGSGANVELTDSNVSGDINNYGANSIGSSVTAGASGSVTLTRSQAGNINSYGGGSDDGTSIVAGGNGGTVTLTNSNVSNITSVGGVGDGGDQVCGASGAVTLVGSRALTINAYGQSSDDAIVSNGASVNLTNSSAQNINTYGGEDISRTTNGGHAGQVILTNSNASNINSYGGIGGFICGNGANVNLTGSNVFNVSIYGASIPDTAGNGGNLIAINSTAYYIFAYGGSGSDTQSGNGGDVSLTGSNVSGDVDNYGGGGSYAGSAGNINATNSHILRDINAYGGQGGLNYGGMGTPEGGDAGNVIFINSSAGNFNVHGGDGFPGSPAGNGGNIELTNSNFSNLYSYGGSVADSYAGVAGDITINNDLINLSSRTINLTKGDGEELEPGTTTGKLTLNYTTLIDTGATYSDMYLKMISSNGIIDFGGNLISGANGLSSNVNISANFAEVKDSATPLNKSANITLYNVPVLSRPIIMRNGDTCPSGICTNYTALSGTVLFSVTGFSNYSIGEQDASGPVLSFVSPSDSGIVGRNYILANVSAVDSHFANLTIYLYNQTSLVATNFSLITPAYKNFTGLTDGTYYLNATAYDTLGNLGNSSTYTINVDTASPALTITSPGNNTNSSDANLDINYVVSDFNLQSCWYSNDTMSVNTSLGSAGSCANITSVVWSEGQHNVRVWANDSAGNLNSSSVTFTIDSVAPALSITSPQNMTYNTASILVNFSADSYQSLWYNNESANRTYTSPETITLGQGSHTFRFYANDSAGNLNSSSLVFFIDSVVPLVDFASGTSIDGDIVNTNVTINLSVTDTNYANVTYRLYNSANVLLNTSVSTSTNFVFSNLSLGAYKFNATVYDVAGNINSTSTRNISVLRSCLEQCNENDNCLITSNCTLYDTLCTGYVCNFLNLSVGAWVYTLYDSAGNGNNLSIDVNGTNVFTSSSRVIFSGRNGSLNSGVGGNASTVSITVPNLFNTTNARFVGVGGNSSVGNGGNGGQLVLNYRGLIGGTDTLRSNFNKIAGIPSGVIGSIVYNKNITCTKNVLERDADIDGDGVIDSQDKVIITGDGFSNAGLYNINSSNEDFNESYDISCDNKLNVVELSRQGFEWQRGIPQA